MFKKVNTVSSLITEFTSKFQAVAEEQAQVVVQEEAKELKAREAKEKAASEQEAAEKAVANITNLLTGDNNS